MNIEYMTNKKVIFVGPSPCIRNKGLGEWIDSFDIVVRTNGSVFFLDDPDFNRDYGSKYSVLFFNSQFQRHIQEIDMDKLKARGLKHIYCKSFNSPLYDSIIDNGVPVEVIVQSPRVLEIRGALMGAIILDMIVSASPKEFHITGVDFYSNNKQKYYPGYLPESIIEEAAEMQRNRKTPQTVHDSDNNHRYIYELISSGKVKASSETINSLEQRLGHLKEN